jgi:tRNA pseudouridine 55 synthase
MDGLIIIDKPAAWTSHDVVAKVRRILGTKRVGHTGTLDPFATGVLLVCVGKATRLSQFLVGCKKTYQAVVRLGFATDTQDCTGKPITPVVASDEVPISSLKMVLEEFLGKQKQLPPMYSAKKIDGIALHKLARKNIEVERQPSEIEILDLKLTSDDWLCRHDDGTRELGISVRCSAGTYVRTLAHDIGQRLGCGAHLTALRRTAVGDFTLDKACTLESLAISSENHEVSARLIPMQDVLPEMALINVTPTEAKALINGQRLQCERDFADGQSVRAVMGGKSLIGIASFDRLNRSLIPSVILADMTSI